MLELNPQTAASVANPTSPAKVAFLDSLTGKLRLKDSAGATETASEGGGGGATVPIFGADATVGRIFAPADIGNLINYTSAAIGTFTVPTDAALSLTGSSSAVFFKVYIKSTGRADIVAGAGVTVRNYAGFPTPAQNVMQTCTRISANEWTVE